MENGKKGAIQDILNSGNKAKRPDETYVQYTQQGKTTQRPKAEAKIEQKKMDADKPILGKHTEKVIKDRQRDKDE